MYHAYTLLVMASIIASAPTYASETSSASGMTTCQVASAGSLPFSGFNVLLANLLVNNNIKWILIISYGFVIIFGTNKDSCENYIPGQSGSDLRGLVAPLLVESRRALKPTLQNMFISNSTISGSRQLLTAISITSLLSGDHYAQRQVTGANPLPRPSWVVYRRLEAMGNICVCTTCLPLALYCKSVYCAGSCLSYGHSCWGAHGKRSSSGVELVPASRQDRLTSFLLSQQQRSRQDLEEPEEVVVMGQPQLTLYQILDQLPRNYQGMNPINN